MMCSAGNVQTDEALPLSLLPCASPLTVATEEVGPQVTSKHAGTVSQLKTGDTKTDKNTPAVFLPCDSPHH